MPPKTKALKANIDKYIFLFSKHASKTSYTDTNGIVRITEYGWTIEPQTINKQSTLELVQKDFSNYGEETATAVVNVLTASTATVTVTNAITNGYYTTQPAVSFTGTGTGSATGTAVLTSGRVTSVTIGGTSSGLIIPTSVGTITIGGGGTGYNVIPNVAFTGGGGSGATATAVLTAGVVTSITLSPAYGTGLNYTSAPTISFTGGASMLQACELRWVHAGDMNWWLLFLSTATIFFARRASQGNPIPSPLALDCTYG